MDESKTSTQDMSAMVAQGVEQARGAMENYLKFFEKSMSASPWAGTELSKKLTEYAEKNVGNAFGFAQKLTQAKDLQDMVRIQTEYFQSQLGALTTQTKDLTETATKAIAGSLKGTSDQSS
ncbi:MAG: phasin family protein [Halobacteriota archaeon]